MRPPMRSKLGWKRPPVAPSIRLSTYSRSRKARNTGVIAPSCTPRSPRNRLTLAILLSSNRIVRMCCARGRRLDVHQLLGSEDERHLVGEAAEPVDAVDQRGDLREGADLGELLVAAVHVAGDRLGPHHLLAVEPGDDPQRAVRGRVLGTDVEGHALGLELDVEARVGCLGGDVRQLLALVEHGHAGAASPSSSSTPGIGSTSTMPGHGLTIRESNGKSLRNGIALELARQVEVAQVGMTVERDAEHLVRLALVPVGTGEERDPGRHRHRVGDVGLDGDADVTAGVGEAGQHLEPRLAAGVALLDGAGVGRRLGGRRRGVVLALAVRRGHPVDRRQEAEVVEPVGLQRRAGGDPGLGRDPNPELALRQQVGVEQLIAERRAQLVDDAFAQTVTRQRRSVGGCVGGCVTQSDHPRRRSVRCRPRGPP